MTRFDIGFDKVISNAHGASYVNLVSDAFKYVRRTSALLFNASLEPNKMRRASIT